MATERFDIDLAHSGIHFSVRHMVISKVRGQFTRWTAAILLDEQDLTRSSVEVSIEAASIQTGVADRDAHLRSADFLEAERHPALTFKSRRVERRAEARYAVTGDLTIRGTTREVLLDVEYGGRARDPWGNERAGLTARTSIDRKAFGLVWNTVLEAGGVLVGDHVDIEVDLEAIRASASASASTSA